MDATDIGSTRGGGSPGRARSLARAASGWLHRHAEGIFIAGFFPLLVAVLYWPIWRGRQGIGWDLIESYWPDLAFFAHQLARGDFPLWNPYERGGYPAHADPQPGLFYPLNWVLALVGALLGKTSWWLGQIKDLLHHALAGVVMHLYLRARGLPFSAALYGGAAVLLGGTWMGEKSNNFLHALVWVPLIWLATDALLAKPTWRRACGLAAALYLPASVGSPPGYFYALLMALGYGAFRTLPWITTRLLHDRRAAARPILRLLAWVGLAAGLTLATQILLYAPGLELTAFSSRASRGLAYALHGEMGMIHTLIGIVSPANGTAHSYLGLGTLVLVLVALVARPRRDGGAPVFFVVLGGFFLILAFGGQTPLLTWFVQHVPGFDLFRACGRYRVLFGMCLAATSAHGLAYLLEARRRRLQAVIVLAALAVVTGLLVWLVRSYPVTYPAQQPPPGRSFLILAGAAGLLLPAALLPVRWARIPAWLCVGLLLADPNGFMHHTSHGFWARLDHEAVATEVEQLPGIPGYRVFDEFLLEERTGSRRLLREMRGYSATDPLSTVAWQNVCTTAGVAPQILGELNVRYILHAPHPHKGIGCCHFIKQTPDTLAPTRIRAVRPGIYEILHPAPWVALYGGLQVVPPGQELAALLAARGADGMRRVAVVAQGELERAGVSSAAARPLIEAATAKTAPPARLGRVTRFESERVGVEIDAPAAGVVVLNEANYPGWRVFVDEKEAAPFTVDAMLRGVLVPAGKHRLVWRYTPRRWALYAGLWWLGMAAFAFAAATAARERTKRTAPPG